MSITLELTAEEEAQVRDRAEARGMNIPDYLRQLIAQDGEPVANASADRTSLPSHEAQLREARRAICAAQQDLLDHGIGIVFTRGDDVIQRNPDGSEEVLRTLGPESR